jgi:uncharacterized membrane protein
MKVRYVSYPSLARDEPFSVYSAQFSVSRIISELSQGNNPPLYELFLHYWIKFFGISEFAVRLPSVIFSSITVYFIYKICQKFFSTKAAILAAVLFTFSNYEMYFAHEARVYSLFMLLTVISMFLYLSLLKANQSRGYAVALVIVNILLLYSHFFSWFVIFVQIVLAAVVNWKSRERLIRFAKYYGVILIFYIPYFGVLWERFFDSSGGTWVAPVEDLRPLHTFWGILTNDTHIGYLITLFIGWLVLQKYISESFKNNVVKLVLVALSTFFLLMSSSIRIPFFQFENDFSSPFITAAFLLFFTALFIYCVFNQRHTMNGKVLLMWLVFPILLMYIASFSIPMFVDRYLIYVTPAFYIVMAIAVSKLSPKYFMSISLLLAATMIFSFKMTSNNERDVKRVVETVKKMKSNTNSGVFICPDYFGTGFSYYYNRGYFADSKSNIPQKDLIDNLENDSIFLVSSSREVDSICKGYDFRNIIYVDAAADFSYPENKIKGYLTNEFASGFGYTDSVFIPGIYTIYTYSSGQE